jgi:hypothetical protein
VTRTALEKDGVPKMNVTDGLETTFNLDDTTTRVDRWRNELDKPVLIHRVS